MLADILGVKVETVASPQNVGAVGAAAVVGVGLGLIDSLDSVGDFIPADHVYEPNPENKEVYERNYKAFRTLYANNKKTFAILNG